jgi:hypothetical protein
MATNQQAGINPQAVRSHARGKRFWSFLIAPWPIGVLLGLASSLVFGVGMAVGIASGLAIALGLNFVWVVVVLAIDDGDVDDRAHEAVVREKAGHEAARSDEDSEPAASTANRR